MLVDHLVPVGINVKEAMLAAVVPVRVKDVMDLLASVKMTIAYATRLVVSSPVVMVSQFTVLCVV